MKIELPKSLTTVTWFSKILALILFFTFICAGFLIGSRYQYNIDLINLEHYANPPIAVVTPSPEPTTDNSSWRTYTNKEWGFSIKYPNEWSEEGLQNQLKDQKYITTRIGYPSFSIYFGNMLTKDHIGKNVPSYVNNLLQITAFNTNTENLSLQNASNKFPYCSGIFPKGETRKINGRDEVIVFKNTTCSLAGSSSIAYIIDGKRFFQIINNVRSGSGNIDQILSTFKFTPASSTDGDQITPACTSRPACLDATPRCMLPEPEGGWCK